MKIKALYTALNTKKALIVMLIIASVGFASAGTLLYFAGDIQTAITVGTGSNPDVYDVTIEGESPPFFIEENLTLLPDENIMIEYDLRNFENFPVTFNFDVSSIDTGLELEITDGTATTLSGNSYTVPANDGLTYHVQFYYHVLPTVPEGTVLNAHIEISLTS